MKEWICREMSTSTNSNENGILMIEKELIRCRDCKYDHSCTHTMVRKSSGGNIYCPVEYCSEGKRKEE